MNCPTCRSNELMIKKMSGMERLKIAWTGMRKYRCRACDSDFRAADRRKTARAENMGLSGARARA